MLFATAAVSWLLENVLFPAPKPRIVLVFSGKRKSGKDYLTDLLKLRLGEVAAIVRLSEPLKSQYAKDHNLDLKELLSAGPYKEQHRLAMIKWGEEQRNADPGFFCRLSTAGVAAPVWIVSDARRVSDIEYFKARFNTFLVRVESSEASRKLRGWVFTPDIDEAESECGLDGRKWNLVIKNEGIAGNTPEVEQALALLIDTVNKAIELSA
eukprot:m.177797 g.177797  ORF g.177797 m.177797 type:complete len:210 (+) comp17385_c0_seq1:89-718(+)